MGLAAFRKIQFGKETTHGTKAAATGIWLGTLSMRETPSFTMPEEDRGSLSKYHRVIKAATLAELRREGTLTFEQCVILFLMGIKGGVTPTQLDSETEPPHAYEWDFTPNLTEKNNPDSFTIEYGDDVQAFYSTYCLARRLEISGAIDEPLQLRADLFGQKVEKAEFTAGLSMPTVEDVLAHRVKLYIEDSGTALDGATAKAKTLSEFTWTLDTGFAPKKFIGGEVFFEDHSEQKRNVELEMVLELNSQVAGDEFNAFKNQTKRFIRLEVEGSTIVATYNKKLTLDLCGIYTDWDTLAERDGTDVVTVRLTSVYDPTWGKEWLVKVVNDQSGV